MSFIKIQYPNLPQGFTAVLDVWNLLSEVSLMYLKYLKVPKYIASTSALK